jgi:diguanylate cyclase (GGDEF)-like protein/PAS domain S-box-containing protein
VAEAALRIVIVYAVFAGLWILLSDKAVALVFTDPAKITLVSMIKGWLFVTVTSLLLYGLIRRLLGKILTASMTALEAQTERMRTEQLLDNIADSSPDAIFAKDLKGRYLLFNRETSRVVGKTTEQALGCDDALLFPEQAEMIRANDRRVIAENRISTFEETISTVDGERTYLAIKGPLRNGDGEVIGMFGISRDITERKRVEAALRESEHHYRSLFSNAVIAMLRSRPDGSEILDCNDKFLEITGKTREEVIGSPSAIIWADPRQREEMIRKLDAEGTVTDIEFGMLNAHGEVRHCISSLRLFREENLLEGSIQDITERKAAADKIEHLAFYDPLTDLPNRRLLLDRLQQALASSTRHGRYGALMLLDMDDFKTLNDTLGHDVGDKFLVEVAVRLQACVREGDTVARHGGDEFVVILEDLNEDALAAMQAESVAVKILRAVSQPYQLQLTIAEGVQNTRSYHCTSSIGITLFRDGSISVDELMKRADTAMYQAKASGRNLLRFFDPEMQAVVTARAALDNDLRVAVRENQFLLYYQPQVDAVGHMTGAEALVRWQHPVRGMVSPAEFIPLAEATGLILPIGHWVLETACAQLVVWATSAHMSHLTLAVNVSARQFRHPDFVDKVSAIIKSTGVNPKKLKLELTESLLLDDVEDIIVKMSALKARGVGFSLDDFGTGYSSLSYLKRLPLDQLKIDQSFVRDILTDTNDATIARTIVALAQSMGLAVIAEGVETEAQREFLAANGCTAYQGYLFGRPMPVDFIEGFAQRS